MIVKLFALEEELLRKDRRTPLSLHAQARKASAEAHEQLPLQSLVRLLTFFSLRIERIGRKLWQLASLEGEDDAGSLLGM